MHLKDSNSKRWEATQVTGRVGKDYNFENIYEKSHGTLVYVIPFISRALESI